MPKTNYIIGGIVMPRRDGTGPKGNGARTGRGIGPCNGNNDAATTGLDRRGRGVRRKCGRSCRWDKNYNLVDAQN
jgi:hypothetical protein